MVCNKIQRISLGLCIGAWALSASAHPQQEFNQVQVLQFFEAVTGVRSEKIASVYVAQGVKLSKLPGGFRVKHIKAKGPYLYLHAYNAKGKDINLTFKLAEGKMTSLDLD